MDALKELGGRYHEEDAKALMQRLLDAVHYMHLNGVVHRDLKLENLILKRKGDLSSVTVCSPSFITCFIQGHTLSFRAWSVMTIAAAGYRLRAGQSREVSRAHGGRVRHTVVGIGPASPPPRTSATGFLSFTTLTALCSLHSWNFSFLSF